MDTSFTIKIDADFNMAATYAMQCERAKKKLFEKDGREYFLLDGVVATNTNTGQFHGAIYCSVKNNIMEVSKDLQKLVDSV